MIARSSRHTSPAIGAVAALVLLAAGALAVQRSGAAITVGTATLSVGGCPLADSTVTPDPRQRCSTLDIPLDRDSSGRKIRFSISQHAEEGAGQRQDTGRPRLDDSPGWMTFHLLRTVAKLLPQERSEGHNALDSEQPHPAGGESGGE